MPLDKQTTNQLTTKIRQALNTGTHDIPAVLAACDELDKAHDSPLKSTPTYDAPAKPTYDSSGKYEDKPQYDAQGQRVYNTPPKSPSTGL